MEMSAISVVVATGGLGVALLLSACARGDSAAPAIEQGATELPSDAEVQLDQGNQTVRRLHGADLSRALDDSEQFRVLQANNDSAGVVLAFIAAYKQLFRLQDPANELVVRSVERDSLGLAHVRLDQVFNGMRVWSGELNVHLDAGGRVYLVQGAYHPTPASLDQPPRDSEERARAAVAVDVSGVAVQCEGCTAEAVVFFGSDNVAHFAWEIRARVNEINAWVLVVDARSAQILYKQPLARSGG
jgi:Zn-dependent metalloprotease